MTVLRRAWAVEDSACARGGGQKKLLSVASWCFQEACKEGLPESVIKETVNLVLIVL